MLLGSPRYYPKAQIRQCADRISAPTRHGHATGRERAICSELVGRRR
jgi:hypothetical protein